MAGILDSLFGDLQGTSAGGLLGLLGGGGIGTATRRLRTPEEEALAGYTPTDYTPAPPPPASLKGDYLGGTPAPPPLGPPINVPSLQVAGAPNGPYAQYSPTSAPAAPLPQQGSAGLGGGGAQNPLMGLLGGIGNLFGTSSAQAAPAPGTAQQPGIPAPAAAGPASPAGPGLFGRLQAGATNFTTGGNPIAGLLNAVGGLATGQRTDRQGIALQNQAATEEAFKQALVTSGKFTPQQAAAFARAASFNPEIAKTLAQEFDMKPQLVDMGTDPFSGMKMQGEYDPRTHRITPLTPGGGTPGQAMPATTTQIFDKIEQIRNAGGTQQEMLQTLPNSVRDATGALLAGRAIPANFSMRGQARDIMLRAATAIDPNFDATKIPMRTTFAQGMAQTSPTSNGGQKLLLNTSLQHLASWADHYVALNNRGAGIASDIPGSEAAASTYNAIANSATKYSEHVNAANDLATKVAGETGKLYSGQSGGGEREREATQARLGTKQSPQSAIGALEATREAIVGKLNSLQNQRDQAYGTAGENIYPLIDPQTKVALQRIDAAIAKLRGEAGPQQGAESQQTMRPIDKQALDWANANPKDPRAAAIKQRLGVQ